MRNLKIFSLLLSIGVFFSCAEHKMQDLADPLHSWNEGKTKQSIIDFVNEVAETNYQTM